MKTTGLFLIPKLPVAVGITILFFMFHTRLEAQNASGAVAEETIAKQLDHAEL